MFGLFKRSSPDIAEALTNQTIGGQSVIYRLFRETLAGEDSAIRRLELTYFASSVTSFTYLSFGKQPNREEILDDFAQRILKKSIPSSGEQLPFAAVVTEYQRRHAEYGQLLALLFDPQPSTSGNPATTLLLHAFECVTGASARTHMLQITVASRAIPQFVADHVDFVKKKL